MSVDISQAFITSSETISDFFQRPGVGYYIPLYQRPYSWDTENIDQLMSDICRGVDVLLSNDKNIHFLGTVILVKESNPFVNINPQDRKALPLTIYNVIDGQQRISTITLLACLLYQRLEQIRKKLPNDSNTDGLKEAIDSYLATLWEIFSVDLRRGSPHRKPIIIRGAVDGWTFEGDDKNNYKSQVSYFLASFIRAITEKSEFPQLPPTGSSFAKNIRRMNLWLKNVEKAYEPDSDDEEFPPAWEILTKMSQVDLWSYERPELISIVEHRSNPISTLEEQVCSLVQLFAFCHYLLQRCCFTLNEPVSEDWAFDMFQSLNATGTPLTALETFKPLVVNFVNSNSAGFKGSKSEDYFEQVDELLSSARSASSKNKLTNDYLTLFALTHDGTKLPTQFSAQRKWLTERYNGCKSMAEREEFIRRMGDLATYLVKAVNFEPNQLTAIPKTEKVSEPHRKQAALCILYLKDAGHKMANAIVSRFYALVIREEPNADNEFVYACKAVAAFFTLWRSALPNTGLDDVYRKLLREQMSWEKGNTALTVTNLKAYFTNILNEKGIGSKNDWKNKATQYLKYDNAKTVCRFALFVTAHDTISDPTHPGLMKIGTSGSSPSYLEPNQWISSDFKSIEHVAPQKPELSSGNDWDTALYGNDDDYEQIGNLTLLPGEINSSAGNKRLIEKWIYYRHLAETDPNNLIALKQEAEKNGVTLKKNTIELLKNTSHKHHILPIVQLGATGRWDKSFVDKRTERICDILWERLNAWLT
jgi:hypothetical protein